MSPSPSQQTAQDAPAGRRAPAFAVRHEPFDVTPDGRRVDAFTLTNAYGMEVRFLAYGGIIMCVRVPGRDGASADVTLGHDTHDD